MNNHAIVHLNRLGHIGLKAALGLVAAVSIVSCDARPERVLEIEGFSIQSWPARTADMLTVTLVHLEHGPVSGAEITVRLAPVEAYEEGLGGNAEDARKGARELSLTTDDEGKVSAWLYTGSVPWSLGVIFETEGAAPLPVAINVAPDATPPRVDCGPSPSGKGGRMCAIPAGWFMMGCSKKGPVPCGDQEDPLHAVYLDAYAFDEHEVTIRDYLKCVSAGACKSSRQSESRARAARRPGWAFSKHPYLGVSWVEAEAFCQWAGKRLPTEAEWERAARGSDNRLFPWGDEESSCAHAMTKDCRRRGPVAVCAKRRDKSPYGVCDLAGNAREWVADWYDLYAFERQENPRGPETGQKRVLRGGSFNDPGFTTTYREMQSPGRSWGVIGIRCARSASD